MTWNNLKTPFKALVVIAIVALSLWLAWPVQQKIHLGLDLQGGSRLLLQLSPTAEVPTITPQIQEQTKEVIDRRINGLGVTEPTITKVGSDRILVELPNVKNPDQAEKLLKQVAVLEFKIVPADVASQAPFQPVQTIRGSRHPGIRNLSGHVLKFTAQIRVPRREILRFRRRRWRQCRIRIWLGRLVADWAV